MNTKSLSGMIWTQSFMTQAHHNRLKYWKLNKNNLYLPGLQNIQSWLKLPQSTNYVDLEAKIHKNLEFQNKWQ